MTRAPTYDDAMVIVVVAKYFTFFAITVEDTILTYFLLLEVDVCYLHFNESLTKIQQLT